jgi:VanZ family protein
MRTWFDGPVAGFHSFLKYWLPVLLWLSLIFSASTSAMASGRTSRIIGPILKWISPSMTPETVDEWVFAIRKAAHVTEYGILGMLLWRAVRKPVKRDPRPWRWGQAGLAFGLGVAYAFTDEFHQTFVPSREGCLRDVGIDSCGVALGLAAVWLIGKFLKRW